MAATLRSTLRLSAFSAIAFSSALCIAVPAFGSASAEATADKQRKASVSADVEQKLKRGGAEAASVIVPVTGAEADALAARHNGRVKKQLKFGVVLEVPGYALRALTEDPAVGQVSGDAKVLRMMAVSATATGADQVWAGIAGLPGYTGRGVGVAVIDSGIANHKALKDRVSLALDFTGGKKGDDEFGHGTHVAGIIAGSPEAGYPGMAPGAHIVSLKALGADGSGDTSDVIAALDW